MATDYVLPLEGGNSYYKTKSSLIIRNSSLSDSGIYVCEATSSLGKDSLEYTLTVTGIYLLLFLLAF